MIVQRLRTRVALGTLASAGVVVVGLALPAVAGEDHRTPTAPTAIDQPRADEAGPGTTVASAAESAATGIAPGLEPLIGSLLP